MNPASTIRLTHILNYFDGDVKSQSRTRGSSNEVPLICTQRRGTRGVTLSLTVIVALFILRVASLGSCLVLCECATPDVTSTLHNCTVVGSRLPPQISLSRSLCLKNPGEQNDVLESSIRLQNV